MQRSIQLVRGADGQRVGAVVVRIAQKHLEDFETLWREPLREYRQEDKFWDWAFKERLYLRNENYEGYAIECEMRTEGLMILETQNHRAQLSIGQQLVYVEALAAAPWNRRAVQRPQELKGVGTALLTLARQRSLELGYGGRVGLHSLPGAERFYDEQNMVQVDLEPEDYFDPEDLPLTYFEYPPVRR